jgi:hypothetical protein
MVSTVNLGNESGVAPPADRLLQVVRDYSPNHDALVLVTHKGIPEWFPTLYRAEMMGNTGFKFPPDVQQGEAVLFDTETGDFEVV